MTMERSFINQFFAGAAGKKVISASTTLKEYECDVEVELPASGSIVVTLPSPSLCAGKIFTIVATSEADTSPATLDISAAGDVGIGAKSTAGTYTATQITRKGGFVCLYCNGKSWFELASATAGS